MEEPKPGESETPENTTEEIKEPVKEPVEEPEEAPEKSELEALNKQLFERAKKAEAEAKANKVRLEALQKTSTKSLDVEDYIDISTSLEGLDQKEKGYLAEQHKLSGKPLAEIRKSEDFLLWQTAYRQKVEKEKLTLKPSGTQPESDKPKTTAERLKEARTLAEKEAILIERGLYQPPRRRPDQVIIGGPK